MIEVNEISYHLFTVHDLAVAELNSESNWRAYDILRANLTSSFYFIDYCYSYVSIHSPNPGCKFDHPILPVFIQRCRPLLDRHRHTAWRWLENCAPLHR